MMNPGVVKAEGARMWDGRNRPGVGYLILNTDEVVKGNPSLPGAGSPLRWLGRFVHFFGIAM